MSPHLGFHTLTPAGSYAPNRLWRNVLPQHVDVDAAGVGAAAKIDLFGSNVGLLGPAVPESADDESDEDP